MSVWVQLYYEGKEKPAGHPININPAPKDVADLTKEVKAELPHSLSHCDAANLSVYPPDTDVTIEGYEDKFIKPWEEVPSTDPLPGERTPRPVIAMAPAKADAAIADAADQRFQKVSGVTKESNDSSVALAKEASIYVKELSELDVQEDDRGE